MYLVCCPACRIEFANEARVCPRCGHLRNHVRIDAASEEHRTWPAAQIGESTWQRGRGR
jgi:rRNA maturation endonuclease Nob1